MSMTVRSGQHGAAHHVLSPWADADPVPLRGIEPRLKDLEGRKIGLFSNGKRAAHLVLNAFERGLSEKCPSATTSWYVSTRINTPESQTEGKSQFEGWVREVDAVVLAVGD